MKSVTLGQICPPFATSSEIKGVSTAFLSRSSIFFTLCLLSSPTFSSNPHYNMCLSIEVYMEKSKYWVILYVQLELDQVLPSSFPWTYIRILSLG
jgi:hypothetical protein